MGRISLLLALCVVSVHSPWSALKALQTAAIWQTRAFWRARVATVSASTKVGDLLQK